MNNKTTKKTKYEIPAILTPSTREVLQHFDDQIVELDSGGSTQVENVISPNGDFDYEEKEVTRSIVSIDYQKRWENSSTPTNEINKSKANELCQNIHTRLKKHGHNKNWKYDCPVNRVVFEVQDDNLKEKFGTNTNSFMLEFVSMSTGGSYLDETQKLYEKRGLDEQGFNLRNLLLRSITDEHKYFDPRIDESNISWDGFGDVNMPFESTLSSDINNLLPNSISRVVTLNKSSEERLVFQ